MRLPLLPLFVLVPLAEILLLIEIGKWLGILPTIALVLSTAIIGLSLLKRQGLSVLAEVQASLDRGEMPVRQAADGAGLLVAGAFLLTPGLITDTAGFLLLVPRFRRWLASVVMRRLMTSGHVIVGGHTPDGPHPQDSSGTGQVIETEYHEVEPGEPPSRPEGGKRPGTPWNPRD